MGSKVACATLSSLNAGDQNILILQQWPSRHFCRGIVGIKDLDPQDHGRDTFILGIQTLCFRSCGPCVFLIPEMWGSNHAIQKIMGSKAACATL
jgi:hypothetical protein